MLRAGRILLALSVLLLASYPVLAKGNANFVLGARALDEDQWQPLDDHAAFGVNVDFGKDDWPVTIVLGSHSSTDATVLFIIDIDLDVTEFSVGVQKTWDQYTHARPYISGGLAFISGDLTGSYGAFSAGDDDSSGAVFFDGGIFWRIGTRFNLGVNARFVAGSDLTIAGVDVDVDYVQVGGLIGWGW